MSDTDRRIATSARVGDGPIATTHSALTKSPSGELRVPVHFRTTEGAEGIALGFRHHMFSLNEDDGRPIGEVSTGAGWGTDAIIMRWGDHQATVRGLDLLRAWVATFDPEAAKRIPGSGEVA